MTIFGIEFEPGEVLEASKLNLLASRISTAVNTNTKDIQTERQRVDAKFIEEKERVDTRLEAIEERDIDITQEEYEQLVEEGRIDPTKNYYISED